MSSHKFLMSRYNVDRSEASKQCKRNLQQTRQVSVFGASLLHPERQKKYIYSPHTILRGLADASIRQAQSGAIPKG